MADTMHQPRDENGQYISLGTLFERERQEHMKDHEREASVARDTAIRLSDEVRAALVTVSDTARLHAVAHAEQHDAHKSIHSIEKDALLKADETAHREAERLKEQLSEFKNTSNEWRGALRDQASGLVTRQQFDTEHERLILVEKKMAYYAGAAAAAGFLLALVTRLLGIG